MARGCFSALRSSTGQNNIPRSHRDEGGVGKIIHTWRISISRCFVNNTKEELMLLGITLLLFMSLRYQKKKMLFMIMEGGGVHP